MNGEMLNLKQWHHEHPALYRMYVSLQNIYVAIAGAVQVLRHDPR